MRRELSGVAFTDVNNGWAVGDSGTILCTTDGGANWTSQVSGTTVFLYEVAFVDSLQGWVAANLIGGILRTTDGGATWFVHDIPPGAQLYDLAFPDADHGWGVGWNGAILHYAGGTSFAPNPSESPAAFALFQNYPNPFNPITAIAYDLSRAGHISLRVFNVLGREVAMLKNGFAEAGAHHVTFDGSHLASGIYFVRLDAGGLSQTRKMVLLK